MLEIKNLYAGVVDNQTDKKKEILSGINLTITEGEVHVIMGPNGSGKSTLGLVLAGNESYEVDKGEVIFKDKDLLDMDIDERAHNGLFLAFQYPVEIPGVSNKLFLQTSLNSIRAAKGQAELSDVEFRSKVQEKITLLNMPDNMLDRDVNYGFSGGEKKRNDILQMALLEPELCIMDETDSGLDIDALQIVSKGVNSLRDVKRSFLIITHYQRLLNYIKPDFVHVLYKGKIIESGDASLALKLENEGYEAIIAKHS